MSLSRSEISLLTAGPLFRGVSEELLQALAGAEGASLVRFAHHSQTAQSP